MLYIFNNFYIIAFKIDSSSLLIFEALNGVYRDMLSGWAGCSEGLGSGAAEGGREPYVWGTGLEGGGEGGHPLPAGAGRRDSQSHQLATNCNTFTDNNYYNTEATVLLE